MSRPQGGWLVPIGEVLSCPVAVHKSCFLLPLGAVLMQLALAGRMWDGLLEVLVALAIWASIVVVHEFGHLLSIKIQRLPCRQALIYPAPFVSIRNWGVRGSTSQRAAVALMGPVASLAFSVLCLPLITFRDETWPLALCAFHALVGIVNLLPIEPFDGAVIWHRRSEAPAKPEVEPRLEPTSVEEFLAEVSEPEPELIPLDDDPPLDVDQILEKILATGMESLTESERTILQEASRHLRR